MLQTVSLTVWSLFALQVSCWPPGTGHLIPKAASPLPKQKRRLSEWAIYGGTKLILLERVQKRGNGEENTFFLHSTVKQFNGKYFQKYEFNCFRIRQSLSCFPIKSFAKYLQRPLCESLDRPSDG